MHIERLRVLSNRRKERRSEWGTAGWAKMHGESSPENTLHWQIDAVAVAAAVPAALGREAP